MFIPNYNMVNRFANARVNGCKDEQFEAMMKNENGIMDLKRNYYDSSPRLENCVSEIIEEPNITTNINTFGDKNEYSKVMTNNLNNNNFTSAGNIEITQERNKESYTPTTDNYRYQYMSPMNREYYEPPYYENTCNNFNQMENSDSFLDKSFTFSAKQMIIVISALVCLFGFMLVIGIICYKNKQLNIKLEEIEHSINNNKDNKQYIYIPTNNQHYIPNQNTVNEDDHVDKNNMSVSPMVPVGVL